MEESKKKSVFKRRTDTTKGPTEGRCPHVLIFAIEYIPPNIYSLYIFPEGV